MDATQGCHLPVNCTSDPSASRQYEWSPEVLYPGAYSHSHDIGCRSLPVGTSFARVTVIALALVPEQSCSLAGTT